MGTKNTATPTYNKIESLFLEDSFLFCVVSQSILLHIGGSLLIGIGIEQITQCLCDSNDTLFLPLIFFLEVAAASFA
jgi:hypothetical protein